MVYAAKKGGDKIQVDTEVGFVTYPDNKDNTVMGRPLLLSRAIRTNSWILGGVGRGGSSSISFSVPFIRFAQYGTRPNFTLFTGQRKENMGVNNSKKKLGRIPYTYTLP
jgi:hypothetical protein